MRCSVSNNEIPPARLRALPNAKTCVACSSTGRVAGFPLITGKTTYSELQIVDQATAQERYARQERKGTSRSEGIKKAGE